MATADTSGGDKVDIFILSKYRQVIEAQEAAALHPRAALSRDHKRLGGVDNDHRMPYQRDVDRILHSKAYARYIDKTQVAYLVENDHITHRGLHVQLVSQFSRGIASILRLNVSLVEAIALGHDVGHPPFGHEGEGYLSRLSMEYLCRPFAHPWQSCRLLTAIEPLNLGLAVYDGFLCHDGGMRESILRPRFGKGWEEHWRDLDAKLRDPEETIVPTTLEGCLVKFCDTMSYVGRDIEDAISLGIVRREEVPMTCLGNDNRVILGHLARDLIHNSYGRDYIAISQPVFEAMHVLRQFNFERIYSHPKLKVESPKIERAYRILFTHLGEELFAKKEESYVWRNFVVNKSASYQSETPPWQMVLDYIAGMTDNFFIRTLEKLLVPRRIELW